MLAQGRDGLGKTAYERHQPEQTLLYQLVEAHYPALVDQLAQQGKSLPDHVHREFEAYLKCGRLERGFLRVRCDKCHFERLVAFSCKKRGFCPSCGARRMAETAALLADEVFPHVPLRQWVISFPFPLRYLFAAYPQAMGKVLGIVYRAISTHLTHKAGLPLKDGATGAVTLIQRFGSALNLNIHFHILFLDGVHVYRGNRPPRFQRVKAPDKGELQELVQLISQRVRRCLERQGLLEQDTESAWLDLDPAERHAAMTWAQRLRRVFNIDIEVCSRCGGSVRVIASIEDQETVDRILNHLRQKEQETPARPLLVPPTRAPPGTLSLFAGKDSRPTATH